jgi:hypothetical protein
MPLDPSATLLSFNRAALSCPAVCEVIKYLLKRKRLGKTPRFFYIALQMIKPKVQSLLVVKLAGTAPPLLRGQTRAVSG